MRERTRASGFTLAEVLVALVLVGLGGTLAVRCLTEASREIEGAEVGLRAALLLSEWSGGRVEAESPWSRPAGPGRVVVEGNPEGWVARFEPPGGGGQPLPGGRPGGLAGTGGFGEARSWRVSRE